MCQAYELGISKLGGSGMLTSYAEELWIPVSVTAETAQAAENATELPVQAPEAILMEPPPELFCTKKCGRGAKSSQRDEDYDAASDF